MSNAKAKLKKRQLITRPLLTQYPWYYVHIDLWEPGVISTDGHRYVLTVIDRFTRYPEMIPIKDKSAETVARAFFEQVICRHGTCAHVVSDNGSEFCNEVFDVMNRLFGVKRIRTAPYNPRANAPVERLHGFLRGAITALAKDNISEWHRFLPAVAFAYRSTVVKGMGYSPFFLMHGREPVLPGQLVAETKMRVPERTVDFVEELGKRLKYAFQKVIRNDTMTKEERMNKLACLPDERYEVGDRLLHYRKPTDEEESMKITERWHHVMVDLAKHPYYKVVLTPRGSKNQPKPRHASSAQS
jgi:transposase InsO family protein